MTRSDQDIGKKLIEEFQLEHFLEQYLYVTNETFFVTCCSEAPDFVCKSHRRSIGIELTTLAIDEKLAFYEECDLENAIERLHDQIQRKSGMGSNTILVFVCHFELEQLTKWLDSDEFSDYDLAEIWLADFSKLDAFGGTEIFCLAPSDTYGAYTPSWAGRKPYG